MWELPVPVWEKVLRAAAVYAFLLLAMRLTGKRQLGQMSSFDIVVLLMLSNIVQNAMIGNDNSVVGGLIGATTILVLNYGVARITVSTKRASRLLEGGPTVLIHNGHVIDANLKRELLSREELVASLRRQGILSIDEVHVAVLEDSGTITAVRRSAPRAGAPPSA